VAPQYVVEPHVATVRLGLMLPKMAAPRSQFWFVRAAASHLPARRNRPFPSPKSACVSERRVLTHRVVERRRHHWRYLANGPAYARTVRRVGDVPGLTTRSSGDRPVRDHRAPRVASAVVSPSPDSNLESVASTAATQPPSTSFTRRGSVRVLQALRVPTVRVPCSAP